MKQYKKSLIGTALTAALLTTSLAASAIPLYSINITGTGAYAGLGITCADNAACDSDAMAKQMTLLPGNILSPLPAIPGFNFSVHTSTNNVPGGPYFSLLDLNWTLSSTASTGGTVTITASATDYTYPVAGALAHLNGHIGGTNLNSSVTGQTWANNSNALFGMGPVTAGVQGPFSAASFSNDATSAFIAANPFSITEQLVLTVGAGGITTGDYMVKVVPEPGSLALIGLGLLAAAGALRRRQTR